MRYFILLGLFLAVVGCNTTSQGSFLTTRTQEPQSVEARIIRELKGAACEFKNVQISRDTIEVVCK